MAGPICALCGVVSAEEGDCPEPGCTGRVSWEATAEAYRQQLAAARELGRELMQYQKQPYPTAAQIQGASDLGQAIHDFDREASGA